MLAAGDPRRAAIGKAAFSTLWAAVAYSVALPAGIFPGVDDADVYEFLDRHATS